MTEGSLGTSSTTLTDVPKDPADELRSPFAVLRLHVQVAAVRTNSPREPIAQELVEDVAAERALELASHGRRLERELPVADQEQRDHREGLRRGDR